MSSNNLSTFTVNVTEIKVDPPVPDPDTDTLDPPVPDDPVIPDTGTLDPPVPDDPVIPDTGTLTMESNGGVDPASSAIISVSIICVVAILVALFAIIRKSTVISRIRNPFVISNRKRVLHYSFLSFTLIILCFTAIKISDNNRNGVSASGDEYLTVTVENPTINIQLDRNKNEAGFGAASSRITVKESTQAGYILSAYVENDGDLISTKNDSKKIAMKPTGSSGALGENTWGMAFIQPENQASTVFRDLSKSSLSPTTIKETDLSTRANDVTTIYYGVHVAPDFEVGTYIGTINYFAVAKVITPVVEEHSLTVHYGLGVTDLLIDGVRVDDGKSINIKEGESVSIDMNTSSIPEYSFDSWSVTSGRIGSAGTKSTTFTMGSADAELYANARFSGTYIQNINPSKCSNSSETTVYDNRDMQVYKIARLKDGNCWMMSNLDLGRTTLTKDLTSANTNITNSVSAGTFNGWKKSVGSESFTSGDFIPVTGVESPSNTPYGTLYNYYAATAGTASGNSYTTDATQDICPAGWRLPTGGDNGELTKLTDLYPDSDSLRDTFSNGGANFTLSGAFGNGAAVSQGIWAVYWSSTWLARGGETDMQALGIAPVGHADYNQNGIFKGYPASRDGGYSIRCILKENQTVNKTISDLFYMQEFEGLSSADKNSVINSMAENTIYDLADERDGYHYEIAKLKDGKVWMARDMYLGWRTDMSNDLTSTNSNLNNTITASDFISWSKDITTIQFTYTAPNFEGWISDYSYKIYNFCAASGKTLCIESNNNNATYDLCPAGWRLPTGGNTGDFQALYTAYGSADKLLAPITEGGAALSLHARLDEGENGYYWSSTAKSSTEVSALHLTTSSAEPDYSYDRKNFANIRCLAK